LAGSKSGKHALERLEASQRSGSASDRSGGLFSWCRSLDHTWDADEVPIAVRLHADPNGHMVETVRNDRHPADAGTVRDLVDFPHNR
jgi:hypothetical protein